MKVSDIEEGRTYLAYCGSLAPVRVLKTKVPFAFPGQVAKRRQGVLVIALADVPQAADWCAALKDGRAPSVCHRQGEEFVIPCRDVDRLADRDVVLADVAARAH